MLIQSDVLCSLLTLIDHLFWAVSFWRHHDEDGIDRDDAVERLTGMLRKLAKITARSKLHLAPVIGRIRG